MSKKFGGIWPALFTPVDEDGEPALDELAKLVESVIGRGLDGLYILGSTGQGVLFTETQRKQVTKEVLQINAGRVPVMVQVGAMTTKEAIRLATHAATKGADAVSSVGPIYFTGDSTTALTHYQQIAAATDLPFFPYQLGSNTMGDIHAFVDQLLQIPNVEGMKLTTGQLLEISTIHLHAGERLQLFSGADELFCQASLCGTVGAIGTFYNLWGEACKQVLRAFQQGDYSLGKAFMLDFQQVILYVLPNIWTFLRKAMQLKYGIDIGVTKAPLGTTQQVWKEAEVRSILERMEKYEGR